MSISLSGIGKKYNRNWLFRDMDEDFKTGDSISFLGRNGSGKSTLLKMVSGNIRPTQGVVSWNLDGKELSVDQYHHHFAIATPYLDLIEEFSGREMLDFHFGLKPITEGQSTDSLLDMTGLSQHADVKMKYYSSGMKQRIRLLTALFADVEVLLLDEPCTNLDKTGIDWYRKTMADLVNKRLVVVASNQEHEYDFCQRQLSIENY